MGLREMLATLVRRRQILVAVPAVAVVLVAAMVLLKPKQYQATATVTAPALVGGTIGNQYSGANGPKSFVANFTAAVTSTPVVDQVAAETHVPSKRVRSGVSASPVGNSTLMRVTYKTPKRSEAVRVSRTAAGDTLVSLFKTQVGLAQQPVDAAQTALADVQAQMATVGKQDGLIVPDKDYEVQAREIATLETNQADAVARGQGAAAAALQPHIDQLKAQLTTIAPSVEDFTALLSEQDVAVRNLTDAEKALRDAQSQLAAADPAQVVTVGKVSAVSRIGAVVPKGAVAGGAGLFLAIGIVAGLELLERARPGDEAAAGWAAQASGAPFASRV
ncbi:MAG: hypothetical protein JO265_11785 [Acidimicrobiia bacterium]|nr:hypothetical protein [Acidimicrobiia bacterium]